jgi:hypothetical protein
MNLHCALRVTAELLVSLSNLSIALPNTTPLETTVIASGVRHSPELTACLGPLSQDFPAYGVAEPYAAVNPRDPNNIVAAWMIQNADRRFVVEASASFDGGRRWLPPRLLPLTTCAGVGRPSLDVATDPWVAFGGDGVAYVSAQTYEGLAGSHAGLQQISVITSPDGGRTWGKPRQTMTFQGPTVKTDNTAVAADSTAPGVAYVVTTRIIEPNAKSGLSDDRSGGKAIGTATLSRTMDGGATWSPAQIVSPDRPGEYADLAQILVDPGRKAVHLVHSRPAAEGGIFIQTSSEGGKVWGAPRRVVSFIGVNEKPVHPATSERIPVADDIVRPAIEPRTGAIAIAFVDGRRTSGEVSQASVIVSRDAGATWTEPLLVSDAASPAWLPSVTWLSPDALLVTYLDGRRPTSGEPGQVNLWIVQIGVPTDGPPTRQAERLVDRFPLLPQRVETPYFLADYYPVFALGRDGGVVYIRGRCADGPQPCVPGPKADPTRSRTEVVFARVPQ